MKLKKLIFPIVVLSLFYSTSSALADSPAEVAARAAANAAQYGYTLPPASSSVSPTFIIPPADGRPVPAVSVETPAIVQQPTPAISPTIVQQTLVEIVTPVVNNLITPVVQNNVVPINTTSQSIPVVLPDNSATTASNVIATEPTGFAVTHTPTPTPSGFLLPDFSAGIPKNIINTFSFPSTTKITKAKKVKTSKK